MGWSIGYDEHWKRDIGYGVPATCDHPGCNEEIDRGLAYVCGGEPYGGERGCGLYFCHAHMEGYPQLCSKCKKRRKPFLAKPDHPDWIKWKLTDESWAEWRSENAAEVAEMQKRLDAHRAAAAIGERADMSERTYRLHLNLGDLFFVGWCIYFAYQRQFWPFVVSLVVTMFFWKTSVRRIKDGDSHE